MEKKPPQCNEGEHDWTESNNPVAFIGPLPVSGVTRRERVCEICGKHELYAMALPHMVRRLINLAGWGLAEWVGFVPGDHLDELSKAVIADPVGQDAYSLAY